MKRFSIVALIIILCIASSVSCMAQSSAATNKGLIQPPPIYVPYKGKVVTEINLSDSDILGLVKQLIPAAKDALDQFSQSDSFVLRSRNGAHVKAISRVDITPLNEAIAGIRNIRVLIVKYPAGLDVEELLSQVDTGVAKAGTFSKVASDYAFMPGAFSLYAQPNNEGYMAFSYESRTGMLYAARIVGFLDLPKLVRWAGEAAATATSQEDIQPINQEAGAPVIESPEQNTQQ